MTIYKSSARDDGKTGQNAAVRRVIVPEKLGEDVQIPLGKDYQNIIGDPVLKE